MPFHFKEIGSETDTLFQPTLNLMKIELNKFYKGQAVSYQLDELGNGTVLANEVVVGELRQRWRGEVSSSEAPVGVIIKEGTDSPIHDLIIDLLSVQAALPELTPEVRNVISMSLGFNGVNSAMAALGNTIQNIKLTTAFQQERLKLMGD